MGWGKVDLGTILKDERAALSIVYLPTVLKDPRVIIFCGALM